MIGHAMTWSNFRDHGYVHDHGRIAWSHFGDLVAGVITGDRARCAGCRAPAAARRVRESCRFLEVFQSYPLKSLRRVKSLQHDSEKSPQSVGGGAAAGEIRLRKRARRFPRST